MPKKNELQKKIEILEKELQKQKTFFENILSFMPGHVYWLDTDNKYLGCNNQQAYDAGLNSREDIVGKTNQDLPWKNQASELDAANNQVLKTQKAIKKIEHTFVDNQLCTYATEKIALTDELNNTTGLVGISVDITKLKQRKQQLEIAMNKAKSADRAKAEFIANMSHDIRTPLTGIIGLASMVENQSHENEIKEYAHMLNISGEQLLSLLNSVLDIVSIDAIGSKFITPSVFHLKELLESIFELELPSLKLKSIAFDLQLDEGLPQFIKSDKEKIYRIILNILSNAIKFTHDGKITIKVTLLEKKQNDLLVKFQIIDTGIGIAKEDISRVFDQFYRANPAYEGKFDGYGVGLHIVQKYLKLLKGEVLVESELGKGTCISLTLPLKKASQPDGYVTTQEPIIDDDVQQHKDANANINTIPKVIEAPKAHVLLVEDNQMARVVVANMLTSAQCTYLDAENSTDAYELFINNSFDFILTDIGLPDYSGLELSKKIRIFELTDKKEQTPIIALSGHAKEEFSAYEFKYGLTDMFTKPLKPEELNQLIGDYGNQSTEIETIKAIKQSNQINDDNEEPMIDVALATTQLGSVEMVKEMAQLMVDDGLVTIIPQIDGYYQAKDWSQFKSLVHKFKSSCLYCATTPLLKLTQELESLSDTKDIEQITPVYNDFKDCADRTKIYIEHWLGQDY